jgi:hypothetical protein
MPPKWPFNQEKAALLVLVCALPFQDQAPPLFGLSIVWWGFAAAAIATVLFHASAMKRNLRHPIITALAVLTVVAAFVETAHGGSLSEVRRVAEMGIGALVISCFCRNKESLRAALIAYVISGVIVSALLWFYNYSTLSSSAAGDFIEASRLREAAFLESGFVIGPNAAGFMAAQGATVALVHTLTDARRWRRLIWSALGAACVLGVLLSMSRGAAALMMATAFTVALRYPGSRLKFMAALTCLAALGYAAAPEATLARITSVAQADAGSDKREARVKVYEASVNHLPDYWAFGVGADNFWDSWGYGSDFPVIERVGVIGSHNAFIQTTIYWGIFALIPLIVIAVRLAVSVRGGINPDPVSVSVNVIALSILGWMMLTHLLCAKQVAIAFGVLIGMDEVNRTSRSAPPAAAPLRPSTAV